MFLFCFLAKWLTGLLIIVVIRNFRLKTGKNYTTIPSYHLIQTCRKMAKTTVSCGLRVNARDDAVNLRYYVCELSVLDLTTSRDASRRKRPIR